VNFLRGAWRPLTLGAFLVFTAVPLAATVVFSVSTRWDRSVLPEGLTLAWWQAVTSKPAFSTTLVHSLFVSSVTTLATAVLVIPTAYIVHDRLPRARSLAELLTTIPFGIPGVVLALALIRLYAGSPLKIVNTPWILVVAAMVISLPFMFRPVITALEAVDVRTLREAASGLGAGPWPTLIMVVLPAIRSGILSGCLLVFSTVFAEFTLANLLVGTRFKTFPIYLVEFTRFDGRQASALAVISFAIAFAIALVVLAASGWRNQPENVAGAR
jgi:putative spermidine/putrescine transport system permease protein